RVMQIEKNKAVYDAAERVDRLYALLSGQVKMVRFFSNGVENLLGKLQSPALLGLDLICTRTRISPYFAIASEQTTLFSFPVDRILKQGNLPENERLEAIGALLQMISHLNMQKEYRLAILTRQSLRERITIYLSMQASRRGTGSFEIPFSREELAAFLSVNRSALSHELGLMRKEGLIDFSKNRFTLIGWDGQSDEWT
ncbi:MAG: Crp/Fnr family transcriptional regulator, partial [Oscillospiraceae bacterium]|nr:Crp/Fnr family transcriptional regulator [Oscillospiraceae bacterium]